MPQLRSMLGYAEKLLNRVTANADAAEFSSFLENLKTDLAEVKALGPASRIMTAVENMTGALAILRLHPNEQKMRKYVVVPAVQKLVSVVQLEVYRAQ